MFCILSLPLSLFIFFFFYVTATTEFYTYCPTLSLHVALPICLARIFAAGGDMLAHRDRRELIVLGLALVGFLLIDKMDDVDRGRRSEEHTSELQSLMRISYAVFCLQKKKY